MYAHSEPIAPFAARPLHQLTDQIFDTLVIGGGINGAGVARDLALRGLSVLLVEKGDYASGTSSTSTKLIHGGLRYLENFDFRLVFEACRERLVLQKIAPHLVQPLPFLIPVYREDPRPLWMIRAGLTLYDLLAMFRNPGRHKILKSDRARSIAPVLQPAGLTGVARYWDCRMDDARLCVENVISAREAGAVVENYLEVVSLQHDAGQVCGAELRDLESEQTVTVQARSVVNTTGPWLDRIRALDGEHRSLLRTTRGTHILVPRIGNCDEALYLTAGSDERLFFVIPWGELSLIGTTDIDFDDEADRVKPTEEDIDYLLRESHRHLKGTTLGRDDVVAAFAGLRPLIAADSESASKVSREHYIEISASGLISLGGGKYTTYRAVAEEISDLVVARLAKQAPKCQTAKQPLPGGEGAGRRFGHKQQWKLLRQVTGLSDEQQQRLLALYGTRTTELIEMIEQRPELAEPVCKGSELLRVQVEYGVRYEMARTPEDLLRRRTPLALAEGQGSRELAPVSEQMGKLLSADAGSMKRWQEDYCHRNLLKNTDDT